MNARNPVSVIIPVYNGDQTIAAAIDSVLAQDYAGAIEVVAVNDGSTDATATVLESYRGRITILAQANRGRAAARNSGVRASPGEYLAFLDADDVWLPHKLSAAISALEKNAGAALLYSNAGKIDQRGNPLGISCTPDDQNRAPTLNDLLSIPWFILPSSVVMPRANFDRIDGFYEQFGASPKWEDAWFMILARELGPFVYLAEPLVGYRVATTVADELERRAILDLHRSQALQIERELHGADLIERLLRNRYGKRSSGMIAAVRYATMNLLVSAGLTAMAAGNRGIARTAYREALHYGPRIPKNYLRLAWTYLPDDLARKIAALLPPRLQRTVAGSAEA
ncbi:MAG: glycosyl transferase [Candidatus Binatus sp.]|nr:glycosyl transferase [Candidatus Binatus sp.]